MRAGGCGGDIVFNRLIEPPRMSNLPELSYTRPRTVPEAIAALKRRGARAYAGGTDLLVAMAARRPWFGAVSELVDIKNLAAAKGISERGASLRIGALTTAAELAASPIVRRHARALAEAAAHTAAPALRRRGPVGGNLVTPHPAGDLTTALVALGATVELVEGAGRRRVAIAEYLKTSAARSRLVLAVHLPKCRHSAFEKLGSRRGFSRSIVAVAVALGASGAGVAIGGVARRPVAATRTGAALHLGASVAEGLAADGLPPADLELVAVLAERAHRRAVRP